jgi:glycosyltransferase involved in cell wall biosynthesis
MTLSVIMAVRDGERHLREALDSVLAQSVGDFEFVIVDDASSDETPAILDAYRQRDRRIRVMRNERCVGPYPSANRGLLAAQGDIIARHDADDVSPPDRFAIQLEMFRRGAPVLVAGTVEMFRDSEQASRIINPPDWQPRLEWELLFTNVIGAGSHVMFPRVVEGVPVGTPKTTRSGPAWPASDRSFARETLSTDIGSTTTRSRPVRGPSRRRASGTSADRTRRRISRRRFRWRIARASPVSGEWKVRAGWTGPSNASTRSCPT